MFQTQYVFRNPTKIARWAKGALWCLAVSEAFLAVVLGLQCRLLAKMQSSGFVSDDDMMAAATAGDLHVKVAALLVAVLAVLATILFLMWVYRTSMNVHALGAQDLFVTPGFAVGSYFIPFFNFYAPPVTMAEVWKASIDASRWREQKGTPFIALWWILQLIAGIGGIASNLAFPTGDDIAILEVFTLWQVAYSCACVLLHLTMIFLVGRISKAQVYQHAKIAVPSDVTAAT